MGPPLSPDVGLVFSGATGQTWASGKGAAPSPGLQGESVELRGQVHGRSSQTPE